MIDVRQCLSSQQEVISTRACANKSGYRQVSLGFGGGPWGTMGAKLSSTPVPSFVTTGSYLTETGEGGSFEHTHRNMRIH